MEMEMVDREFEESMREASGRSVAAGAGGEDLRAAVERLAAAAGALEQLMERISGREMAASQEQVISRREGELEKRLGAAEAELAELRARAATDRRSEASGLRKTVPASVTNLLAKQGVSIESMSGESMQAGALDAAMASLSVEQRIAVKAQLLRAGVLG